MQDVSEKTKHGFALLRTVAVVSAILALLCFVAPLARKSDALRGVGEKTLNEMRAAVTAISYYSSQDIEVLAAAPATDAVFAQLSGLLYRYNTQFDYLKSYLLVRAEDKTISYLVDGSYRGNTAGADYFAPQTPYALNGAYKPVKGILDKIYGGKSNGGYTTELVTRPDLKKVSITCLPVYGTAHTVAAVLCIETDPGNTAYHIAGPVNLYYAGIALSVVFLACILLMMLFKKYRIYREGKLAEKQAAQEQQAQTEQAVDDTAQAVYDDTQTPGDNIDTMQ